MGIGNALKHVFFNHRGTGHKIAHNITTIANIPLVAWFICSVFALRGTDHEQFVSWLSVPINMIVGILFVLTTLTHFTLELEVVFEDYIADEKCRNLVIRLMKILWFCLGAAVIFSVLKTVYGL